MADELGKKFTLVQSFQSINFSALMTNYCLALLWITIMLGFVGILHESFAILYLAIPAALLMFIEVWNRRRAEHFKKVRHSIGAVARLCWIGLCGTMLFRAISLGPDVTSAEVYWFVLISCVAGLLANFFAVLFDARLLFSRDFREKLYSSTQETKVSSR